MNKSSHEKRHVIWEKAYDIPFIDSSEQPKTTMKSKVLSTTFDTKVGSWREPSKSPSPLRKKTTFETDVKVYRGGSADRRSTSSDRKSIIREPKLLEKGKPLNQFEILYF